MVRALPTLLRSEDSARAAAAELAKPSPPATFLSGWRLGSEHGKPDSPRGKSGSTGGSARFAWAPRPAYEGLGAGGDAAEAAALAFLRGRSGMTVWIFASLKPSAR